MKEIFVSVIVPIKELSYSLLYENLPAFEKQDYKHFEVIILPNEQKLYDLTLIKKYPWLRIIPTGKVTRPAQKRDIGASRAKGELLAFLDDDAYPTPTWLSDGVQSFSRSDVAAVGGPGMVPPHGSLWEKVFDGILTTFIGSGSYVYRFIPKTKRFVDDYPSMNFFVRKKVFEKVGGFNNDYWPGEDSKLCNDIVYKEKKRIFYNPRVVVYHHRRSSLSHFLRQHGNYGFHRGAFFAQGDRNSTRITYFVPSYLTLYLTILVLFTPLLVQHPILYAISALPFLMYALLIAAIFFHTLFRSKNLIVSFASAITLVLMHVTYGILFFIGFIKGKTKQNIYG